MELPADIQDYLRERFTSMQQHQNKRESEDAKADPKAHKLSRVMEGKHGMSYRYYRAGKDGRKQSVRFCWTMHRNVAGYFLGWREVESKRQVKRDQWIARKVKRRAKELAEQRAARFREKHQAAPV